MPKNIIILSEHDIAKIINGEEVSTEIKGERVVIRQSYLKDIVTDSINRPNRVINTANIKLGC